ncbi:hypothetical protein [uncultured Microbacterium sp.]|uniref:hypothetical protein n=1 Tax=uncultured Microbacterium sp. TaxID=191216 RepID=UPI0028D8F2FC|nr:hypothetical protein [uncultured Microbacterium sp.]
MTPSNSFLRPRSASVLLGSSVMLLIVVNACVVGLLVGSAIIAGGGDFGWAIALGVVAGLLLSAGFVTFGGVSYRRAWSLHEPRRHTPGGSRRSLR